MCCRTEWTCCFSYVLLLIVKRGRGEALCLSLFYFIYFLLRHHVPY
nr:MAG TPA: hypothetical protein [Caudoviricetes sp.]